MNNTTNDIKINTKKEFLTLLVNICTQYGVFFQYNRTICRNFGISERSVQYWLEHLRALHWVIIIQHGNNRYICMTPLCPGFNHKNKNQRYFFRHMLGLAEESAHLGINRFIHKRNCTPLSYTPILTIRKLIYNKSPSDYGLFSHYKKPTYPHRRFGMFKWLSRKRSIEIPHNVIMEMCISLDKSKIQEDDKAGLWRYARALINAYTRNELRMTHTSVPRVAKNAQEANIVGYELFNKTTLFEDNNEPPPEGFESCTKSDVLRMINRW